MSSWKPHHFPETSPPNTITSGLGLQYITLEERTPIIRSTLRVTEDIVQCLAREDFENWAGRAYQQHEEFQRNRENEILARSEQLEGPS